MGHIRIRHVSASTTGPLDFRLMVTLRKEVNTLITSYTTGTKSKIYINRRLDEIYNGLSKLGTSTEVSNLLLLIDRFKIRR